MQTAARTNKKRFRVKLLRPAVVILAIILALGIAETGLRAFDYRPGTMDPAMYVANPDPLLPYKLQSNYRGYCAGREVNIDADGNRVITPEYSELKQGPAERVVLLVGDSVVFGFGLSNTDTIGSQLQRIAIAQNHDFEIRNIGVSGYTSWNEYQAVNSYLRNQSVSNIVVLYVPNDLTLENDYFGIEKGKHATLDRGESGTREITRWFYSNIYVSYLISESAKRVVASVRQGETAHAASGFDARANQAELDYSMQALERLKTLCDSRKIELQVAIYRDIEYLSDQSRWLDYEKVISERLNNRGIKWFILKSHVDKLPPSEIRVSWNDPHPSPSAAGLIAEDILNSVK